MLGITDLKKGTLIQVDGTPYKVIDYAQKQMGRGGSIVNTKLKNLIDGTVLPKTFSGQEKIEPADVTRTNVQFLYEDNSGLHFMNNDNYDQFSLQKSIIGKSAEFLAEGMAVTAEFFNGAVINVELPIKVTLTVTTSPDVVRGDTQSTVQKIVTLENGAEVSAPIFIKQGDRLVIDTRDGSYVERAK